MEGIKIYVVNLSKYNGGEETGAWFDLPVDMEDVYKTIFDRSELDDNGEPHGDWAIHSYEAPFSISEFKNIETLNEIAEVLEDSFNLKEIQSGKFNADELKSFASSIGCEEALSDFVPFSYLTSVLKEDLKENNVHSIKNKLEGLNYSTKDEDYVILEGDGNFKSVTDVDLSDGLKEVFKAFMLDFK